MPLCGHSILIDEIAAEEQPVFIKWLNSIGGLCREHTKGLDLRITSVPGLRSIAEALFAPTPTIHYAKEATVAEIAAFRAEHYEVMPVFAAGTCKKEKAPECVELIQALLDAWRESPDGEKRHGPIWSVASDGDGVRRAAFHTLFMKKILEPGDPLFALLSALIGLNLQMGEYYHLAQTYQLSVSSVSNQPTPIPYRPYGDIILTHTSKPYIPDILSHRNSRKNFGNCLSFVMTSKLQWESPKNKSRQHSHHPTHPRTTHHVELNAVLLISFRLPKKPNRLVLPSSLAVTIPSTLFCLSSIMMSFLVAVPF
jgi:hypothetical protein